MPDCGLRALGSCWLYVVLLCEWCISSSYGLTIDEDMVNSLLCSTDPCGVGESGACNVYNQGSGCSQCITNNFKFGSGYQCVDCQEFFGNECLHCNDNTGCQQCINNNGFDITSIDNINGLTINYCQENACSDNNKVTTHCNICNNGECSQCENGYFRIRDLDDNDNICLECNNIEITGESCLHCNDFYGCQQCGNLNLQLIQTTNQDNGLFYYQCVDDDNTNTDTPSDEPTEQPSDRSTNTPSSEPSDSPTIKPTRDENYYNFSKTDPTSTDCDGVYVSNVDNSEFYKYIGVYYFNNTITSQDISGGNLIYVQLPVYIKNGSIYENDDNFYIIAFNIGVNPSTNAFDYFLTLITTNKTGENVLEYYLYNVPLSEWGIDFNNVQLDEIFAANAMNNELQEWNDGLNGGESLMISLEYLESCEMVLSPINPETLTVYNPVLTIEAELKSLSADELNIIKSKLPVSININTINTSNILFDTMLDYFDFLFFDLNFTTSSVNDSLTIDINQVGSEDTLQMEISCYVPISLTTLPFNFSSDTFNETVIIDVMEYIIIDSNYTLAGFWMVLFINDIVPLNDSNINNFIDNYYGNDGEDLSSRRRLGCMDGRRRLATPIFVAVVAPIVLFCAAWTVGDAVSAWNDACGFGDLSDACVVAKVNAYGNVEQGQDWCVAQNYPDDAACEVYYDISQPTDCEHDKCVSELAKIECECNDFDQGTTKFCFVTAAYNKELIGSDRCDCALGIWDGDDGCQHTLCWYPQPGLCPSESENGVLFNNGNNADICFLLPIFIICLFFLKKFF